MSARSDIVDVAGELRRETDKAFLIFDGTKEVWLPKALVEYDPHDGTFAMPEWTAETVETVPEATSAQIYRYRLPG